MQERQVTYEGETTQLHEPFIVIATQIPGRKSWHVSFEPNAVR